MPVRSRSIATPDRGERGRDPHGGGGVDAEHRRHQRAVGHRPRAARALPLDGALRLAARARCPPFAGRRLLGGGAGDVGRRAPGALPDRPSGAPRPRDGFPAAVPAGGDASSAARAPSAARTPSAVRPGRAPAVVARALSASTDRDGGPSAGGDCRRGTCRAWPPAPARSECPSDRRAGTAATARRTGRAAVVAPPAAGDCRGCPSACGGARCCCLRRGRAGAAVRWRPSGAGCPSPDARRGGEGSALSAASGRRSLTSSR